MPRWSRNWIGGGQGTTIEMADQPRRKNLFLTDANVYGPAVKLAREKHGVEIIRDVDLNLECEGNDYDVCLFQYAMEQGYILVTANIIDFEWQYYEYAATHETPGIIFIRGKFHRSAEEIAEWLALWADEDFTNRIGRIPPL